jgi:hypothetical protein
LNTIREKIILAILAKLAEAITTNQYTLNCGSNVFRCRRNVDPETTVPEVPCFNVWPQSEEVTKEYGKARHVMPVRVEGIAEFGTSNPSVIAEQMLGDLIEVMTGIEWTLPYTSGGTYVVKAGDIITGHTSGATGLVTSVTITSGSWAAGTAAGNIKLRRLTKEFQAENLDVGTSLNVATISGSITGETPITSTTGGYADSIEYLTGGTDSYPEEGHKTVGASGLFNIGYVTNSGDPYNAE